MLSQPFLVIILIIHFFFVLFITLTPFYGSNYFLILHIIIIPFVMAHWYVNDNNCALTMMEKEIRFKMTGVTADPNDCFTYNLIAPIYDFKKNNQSFSTLIYGGTIALWSFSCIRLINNWRNGKLCSFEDLLRY